MRKLFIAFIAILMMPSNAWAALCPFGDGPATKCEIPLCVQAGFPSAHGCRPALREFIKRAFFGQSPVPFPPECLCTWIPEVVIPTDQYGVPIFLEGSTPFGSLELTDTTPVIQYASLEHALQTPFDKSPALETQNMTPLPKYADANKATPLSQAQVEARTAQIIQNQQSYRTNCSPSMFSRRRSGSCYIISGDQRTDLMVTRNRYQRFPSRRYTYDYVASSRKLDGTGDVNMTRMRIRHDTLESCQIFRNGRAVSDTNCNVSDFHSLGLTPPSEPVIPGVPGGPSEPFIPEHEIELNAQPKPENDGIMVFE